MRHGENEVRLQDLHKYLNSTDHPLNFVPKVNRFWFKKVNYELLLESLL